MGELAGADIGHAAGGEVELVGRYSGLVKQLESVLGFAVPALLIQNQPFLFQSLQGGSARSSFVGEGQGLRPEVRNGRWHRADERDYEQATSQNPG
jgi:hypothetical protein